MIQFSLRQLLAMTSIVALLAWYGSYFDTEFLGWLLVIWLMYACVSAFTAAPIVILSRRRVRWRYWEALALVLPFVVWSLLMFSDLENGRKSLSNMGEPFCFAFATPVVALLRVIFAPWLSEVILAVTGLLILCLAAAGAFFFIPAWPE